MINRKRPAVITGDGAEGWSAGAPYDRTIATCAVYDVPRTGSSRPRPRA
ncbi:hypothetical protein ABZS86_14820 [Streptomyces sp. NPDC005355]